MGAKKQSYATKPPQVPAFAHTGKLDTGEYWLRVVLPGTPKTPNEIYAQASRFMRADNATLWKQSVFLVCHGKEPQRPLTRAKIQCIRHAPRMMDYDGLVGSFKPVIDGLCTRKSKKKGYSGKRDVLWEGILSDDSWDVTGPWDVSQEPAPVGGEFIEVMIWEVIDQPDRKPS